MEVLRSRYYTSFFDSLQKGIFFFIFFIYLFYLFIFLFHLSSSSAQVLRRRCFSTWDDDVVGLEGRSLPKVVAKVRYLS